VRQVRERHITAKIADVVHSGATRAAEDEWHGKHDAPPRCVTDDLMLGEVRFTGVTKLAIDDYTITP